MKNEPTIDRDDPQSSSRGSGPTFTGLSEIAGLTPANPDYDPLLGKDIGGVTIARVIAEGGMGRVYEGKQSKPSRTVAVKVMRPGLASPSLLKRFEYEAEVLGRLQHPGIAHIYSVGVHRLGNASVPYFVMEFIADAKTLTRYAEDLKLPTRQRLDLFRSVCEAVAHGHQKGVIHRDLKPSNILVDATGQPKVIDFGVARATDSDMALTTMQTDVGQLIGTLQYMSPEQFDGNPNDIDIRADVYALGVVLYELLAGKPPYDVKKKAIYEVMRIVKEEEPKPLSSFNRALRGDVAVIAGKCLEKERGRRYSSATEVGADIGRFLSGDPITASPPGFLYGILRLARRHKAVAAAVSGVAASLIAAVLGIAVFAVRAERARATAVIAREAAERLVEFMTSNLRDNLQKIGRLDLMEDVLKELNAYHQKRIQLEQAEQEQVTQEHLGRRAEFFMNMGDVARATGDLTQARGHFERHLEILEDLVASTPSQLQWLHHLGRSNNRLGVVEMEMGVLECARRRYEKSLAIMETLTSREPRNIEWQRDLAAAHVNLSDLERTAGNLDRAKVHCEEALGISVRLSLQDSASPEDQLGLSVSQRACGEVAEATGDLSLAWQHYEKSLSVMEILAVQEPRNAEWKSDLDARHRKLGDLAMNMGNSQLAREHFEKALEISEQLASQDPRNVGWQGAVGAIHNRLGSFAAATGDLTLAWQHYEKSFAIMEALAAQDPRNAERKSDLDAAHRNLGGLAMKMGKTDLAREHFQKSLEISEQLAAQDPRNAGWQDNLSMSHFKIGDLAKAMDDVEQARGHYEEALEIYEKLSRQDARNTEWHLGLSGSHFELGTLAQADGDLACARGHYEKALATLDSLTTRDPRNVTWQQNRSVAHSKLGDVAGLRGDCETARQHYEKYVAIMESLASQDPLNVYRRRELANSYGKLGDPLRVMGDFEGAKKSYDNFRTIMESLIAQDPGNADWVQTLAEAYLRMGLLGQDCKDWTAARDWFLKVLETTDRFSTNATATQVTKLRMSALRSLSQCYRQLGEVEAANECVQRIAELKRAG